MSKNDGKVDPQSVDNDAVDELGDLKRRDNPRVRLSKKAMEIVERHRMPGISTNQIVENALVIAEHTLSFSMVTLSDLAGVMMTQRAAVKDLNLCLLETFELLTDVELLLENQWVLGPLVNDLKTTKDKPVA